MCEPRTQSPPFDAAKATPYRGAAFNLARGRIDAALQAQNRHDRVIVSRSPTPSTAASGRNLTLVAESIVARPHALAELPQAITGDQAALVRAHSREVPIVPRTRRTTWARAFVTHEVA